MTKFKTLIISALIGFVVGCVIIHFLNNPIAPVVEEVVDHQPVRVMERNLYKKHYFSEEYFMFMLKETNIMFPDIVFAQAKLESGNFKSDLFINHNNAFGMKIAKQRPTLNTNKHAVYASYDDWIHSIYDYAFFQSRFMRAYDTREKYLNRLGEVYAEDKSYINKLNLIINEYKNNSSN